MRLLTARPRACRSLCVAIVAACIPVASQAQDGARTAAQTPEGRRKAIDESIAAEAWQRAEDQATAFLAEFGERDPSVYFARGLARGELSREEQAVADFDRAEALGHCTARLYCERAYCLSALKQFDRALAECEEAARMPPSEPLVRLRRGEIFADMGEFDQAIAQFTEYIRLRPEDARGHSGRAYARSSKGDFRNALADYDEAIRRKPGDAQLFCGRGIARSRLNDSKGAEEDLARAARLDPRMPPEAALRGLLVNPDPESLLRAGDLFVKTYPQRSSSYLFRGGVREMTGDAEGALADYDRALQLEPRSIQARLLRAVILIEKDQTDRALADAEEVLKLEPDQPVALLLRADVRVKRGDNDRAIADLDRVISHIARFGEKVAVEDVPGHEKPFFVSAVVTPTACRCYVRRSQAFLAKKEAIKALVDADRAVELSQENSNWKSRAYRQRASVQKQQGRYDLALEDARKAAETAETDDDRSEAARVLKELQGSAEP